MSNTSESPLWDDIREIGAKTFRECSTRSKLSTFNFAVTLIQRSAARSRRG